MSGTITPPAVTPAVSALPPPPPVPPIARAERVEEPDGAADAQWRRYENGPRAARLIIEKDADGRDYVYKLMDVATGEVRQTWPRQSAGDLVQDMQRQGLTTPILDRLV